MRAILATLLLAPVGLGCQAPRPPEEAYWATFRSSLLKPFQEALAADPDWKVSDYYITTRQNGVVTDREGVVWISRGSGGGSGPQRYEGTVFDVTYSLRG